jgi:hypothetical protein
LISNSSIKFRFKTDKTYSGTYGMFMLATGLAGQDSNLAYFD